MNESKLNAEKINDRENNGKRREVSLIRRAGRLHHSVLGKRLKVFDLHRSQHMLLMTVYRANGDISQKDLAERLQITPAAVAMTIKKLEQGGYVLRKADEGDARVNHITVSEKGAEVVRASEEIFRTVDDGMFNGISQSEMTLLCDIMEKINNNLLELGGTDTIASSCGRNNKEKE